MCKNKIQILLLLFACYFLSHDLAFTQTLNLKTWCKLPQSLNESSGLLTMNQGQTFWTHTDGGGGARLYELDTNCNILQNILLKNAQNVDWEEICHNFSNTMYIGDFGNNSNNRKDLKIYILPVNDSTIAADIKLDTISYLYANQLGFPPASTQLHFDMEAFLWFDDTLHLFTKNRTNPFNGICYHYKLPALKGNYMIHPVDSINLGTTNMLLNWVCAAAISPDFKTVCLLGYDKIWIFTNFKGSNFFNGKLQVLAHSFSQKEGLAFINNHELALTDEFNPTISFGGNLYKTSLPYLNSTDLATADNQIEIAIIAPDGCFTLPENFTFPALLAAPDGKIIHSFPTPIQSTCLSHLTSGQYYLLDIKKRRCRIMVP